MSQLVGLWILMASAGAIASTVALLVLRVHEILVQSRRLRGTMEDALGRLAKEAQLSKLAMYQPTVGDLHATATFMRDRNVRSQRDVEEQLSELADGPDSRAQAFSAWLVTTLAGSDHAGARAQRWLNRLCQEVLT